MSIQVRGKKGLYSGRIRVPAKYAAVEPRAIVWVALGTDSRSEAQRRYAAVREQLTEQWDARLRGCSDSPSERFEAAQRLATAHGLKFMPPNDVARLPVDEILSRIELVRSGSDGPNRADAAAFLGGAQRPVPDITQALDIYFDLSGDKTLGMAENQRRIWINPRKKAVANFVKLIGDKPINEITRDDMLDFRQWWHERVASGEVSTNSANKEIGHLSNILSTVNELKRLNIDLPVGRLSLKETDQKVRPPFSDNWIREKLLAPGALDGLNVEARNIVRLMINTGARPAEVAALLPGHIHLTGDFPYIEILPDGRNLKSVYSKRRIPLVGISLQAAQECASGFPRYRDKPGMSGTVNKFLRENGLMESKDHVLYSLRHSFEDRMLAAGIDERIRRDILGHRLDRERYGAGGSLEQVQGFLKAIAL